MRGEVKEKGGGERMERGGERGERGERRGGERRGGERRGGERRGGERRGGERRDGGMTTIQYALPSIVMTTLFRHYTQPKLTPEGEPSVPAQCVTTEQPSLQR